MSAALRAVGLIIAGLLLLIHASLFNFVCDDAFISFRYAENLARHGQLVFNLSEKVEGYSNFLWTLLLAALSATGIDLAAGSKALGLSSALATFGVLARFRRRWESRSSPWDAVPPLLLAAAPAYACWATGGLETQLFTLLVTLGWTRSLLEWESESRRFPWSGIWFALASLTRPEGVLLFGLTLGHRLLFSGLSGAWRRWRREGACALAFAALFIPYFAWRWAYYGWPYPNTYYIKAGGVSLWQPGLAYLFSWLRDCAHLLALPALAAVLQPRLLSGRTFRLFSLSFLLTLGVSVLFAKAGGDFMALHRFFVPVLPSLAVVAGISLQSISVPAWSRRGTARAVLLVSLAVAGGFTGYRAVLVDRAALEPRYAAGIDSIGLLKMYSDRWTRAGRWLAENAAPDASIAVTAAGAIPYYSRLHTLDMLGLNDEWIAHRVEPEGSRPGHTKTAPIEYVVSRNIDYLIIHPTIEAYPPYPLNRSWESFGYGWRVVELPGPDPLWWGFWQRKK